MTHIEDANIDPVTGIIKSKGVVLRGVALLASIAGMVLPSISSSGMGLSQNTNITQIAVWAVLSPIVIASALIIPGVAARFSQLADIVAMVLTGVVVAYVGYVILDAMGQVSQTNGMLGGMAKSYGVSISPSIGLFALAGATVLMAVSVVNGRR